MEFNEILKDMRLEYALSQKDVALGCGLSPQCISQLELGIRNPTGTTLLALADYFECTIDQLMGRTTENGDIVIYQKDDSPLLTSSSKELVKIFNALEREYQMQILEYARFTAQRLGIKIKKF